MWCDVSQVLNKINKLKVNKLLLTFWTFLFQVEQVPAVPDGGRLQGESDPLRPDGGSNRRHAGAVQICPHQIQRAHVHKRHGNGHGHRHSNANQRGRREDGVRWTRVF